jgi:hypothetical protein
MTRVFHQLFRDTLTKTSGQVPWKSSTTQIKVTFVTMLVVLCPVHVLAVVPAEQPVPKVPITCLLIDNASILIQRVEEAPYGRANVGHQIGSGTRTVLSMRAWEDLGTSDTSQLWKVTLEFAPVNAAMPLGKVVDIPVLRSYYTYGGLFWLTGDGYVWGENTIHHVGLVRTEAGLEAVLNGPITAIAAIDGRPTRTTVAWRCNVVRRKVTELDVWEGKPGTTFQSLHPANPPRPVDHP